ncbi:TDP-fucosamine acetyltransferase [compost metagenome]
MAYKYLNWDSEFFGKKVYQIDAFSEIPEGEWEAVVNEKPDLIYCIIEAPSLKTVEFMKQQGGILYDNKIKYLKQGFTTSAPKNNEFHCENTSLLTEDLEEMVYQSGSFSRFNLDPRLSVRFKDLYKEWILGSLNKKLADEVLLAKDNKGNSVGFITLSIRDGIGNIGLIAVTEHSRGRGVGQFLMQEADNFFRKKQASAATVVTQIDNIPACRLYEKMGYTITKNQSIFHCYL